jgi:hypothetical protein
MYESYTNLAFFFAIGLAIGFVSFLIILFPNRSRRYRKQITDFYVAGKIRQLAKKDSIDLDKEYQDFKLFYKKNRIEEQSLDNTIEEDLQDRIVEDSIKNSKK